MERTDVAYLGTEVENLPIGFVSGCEEIAKIIEGVTLMGLSF